MITDITKAIPITDILTLPTKINSGQDAKKNDCRFPRQRNILITPGDREADSSLYCVIKGTL